MKLTSIRIIGMHNVVDKTYNINDALTYFKGPNGAGKSTVLEAIQLVILGYIPGYAKTNESIMKHSSTGKLEVIGTFDDGSTIVPRWIRNGSSVSAKSESIPARDYIELVNEKLELPIYNFSDFKDMTANKLKEWFLSFLPSAADSIDWNAKLVEALGSRTNIISEDLLERTLSRIDVLSETYSGLELIQNLNTHFKTEQSFTKKEIDRLESTVQSLVYYDEDLPDKEYIVESLDKYMAMLKKRMEYDTNIKNYNSIKSQIDALKCVPVDNIEDVEGYVELRNIDSNTRAAFKEVCAAKERFVHQLTSINHQITDLSRVSGSICPYTSKSCKEIEAILEENKKKIAELKAQADSISATIAEKQKLQTELDRKIFDTTAQLQAIETNYTTYFRLKDALANIKGIESHPELTQDEISAEIKKYQESLSKIEANIKYNELIETITKDKFKAMNDLEVLKIWTKLTDANGLQTEIMIKPFEDLANDMNSYLTKMYGQPIVAQFNLSSKANSFSFGLMRQNNYIEFDYLSSGERCLFMLALMICILDKSNANLRTILVDDLIDHLDDKNAANVFESLTKVKEVQFILAGVKNCTVEGVVDVQL